MTTLRDAAQQALKAMRCAVPTGKITLYEWDKAVSDLDAALVEDAMQKFTDVSQEIEAALAEPVQQGCEHCNQPLYAATKCRVCGRVTEPVQEPVAWLVKWANAYDGEAYTEWQKGYDAARSVVKAHLPVSHTQSHEPKQPEPAQEPVAWIHIDADKPGVRFLEWQEDEPGYRGRWIKTPLFTAPLGCPNCASLEDQNTELDRKLAEMKEKLNNPSVDDAFRILAEANRRAIDYINELERQINELKRADPTQRNPLTKVDLRALYDQHAAYQEEGPEASGWWEFARAVEREHRIGVDK